MLSIVVLNHSSTLSLFLFLSLSLSTTPPRICLISIAAVGGNALLKRGEQLTMENQRRNIRDGVASLKAIIERFRGVTVGTRDIHMQGIRVATSSNSTM